MDSEVRCKIITEDCVKSGNVVWFMSNDYNTLYSLDVVNGRIEVNGVIPGENYAQQRLFRSMQLVKGKIYFAPAFARNIAVYDIEKKSFETITLEKHVELKDARQLFLTTQQYKEFVYMLPAQARCIIRVNTLTGEINYISDWIEKYKSIVNDNEGEIYFIQQSVRVENLIYSPFYNVNAILELNCDTLEVNVYKLGEGKIGYNSICYDDKYIWVASNHGEIIVKWNHKLKEVEEIVTSIDADVNGKSPYAGIVTHRGKILCAPIFRSKLEYSQSNVIDVLENCYSFIKEDGRSIYYCEKGSCILGIIDKLSENKFEYELEIASKEINGSKIFKNIVTENERLKLNYLIDFIVGE